MGNSGRLPRESLVRQIHASQTRVLDGFVSLSIIYRSLTWTIRSLTCVYDLFASVYTLGEKREGVWFRISSVVLLSDIESSQNFDSRDIACGRRAKPSKKRSPIHLVTTLDCV